MDLLHNGPLYDKRKFPSRAPEFELTKLAENLGICLIGAGFMGQAHSAAYRNIQANWPFGRRVILQSIVARTAAERAGLRERYGWQSESADWQAAIRQADIALVDIATPTDLHAEIA